MTVKASSRDRRVHTPTVLQMEATECGAASLKMVLDYYGRVVPLEALRTACGVSRDGSKASNVVKAARAYGLVAKGYRKEPGDLRELPLPMIVFWNFNHFLVVEGFKGNRVFLNDPANGPRVVSTEEFDQSFTGVVLTFEPGEDFVKGGTQPTLLDALRTRLGGSVDALVYTGIAGAVLAVAGVILPLVLKVFMDEVMVAGNRWTLALLGVLLVTAAVQGGVAWLQRLVLLRLETKLAITGASQFFWHILQLPMAFFTGRYPGDVAARVASSESIAAVLAGRLVVNTLEVVLVLVVLAVMLSFDLTLTAVAVLLGAVNGVSLRLVAGQQEDANRKLQQEQGKLIGVTYNGLFGIESIKAAGAEEEFFSHWAGHYAKAVNTARQLDVWAQVLTTLPTLLNGLSATAVLVIGAVRVVEGNMTPGTLVAFLPLMAAFLAPINRLVTTGQLLQSLEVEIKRQDDVLHHNVDELVGDLLPDHDKLSKKLSGSIELRGVTFGYNQHEPPLVDDLSLIVKPGQRVALVGASGSGKSTVARLIAGLYAPWTGDILFDGQSRSALPHRQITDSLALVDQDIVLFEGTVRDNLTLWDTTAPDLDVVQAAKDAQIHVDIVQRGGYGIAVQEGGRNFSGGQRQRLEIARALVNNPTILVMDEATSALDPVTEKRVDDALRRRGCTCIIVAHRLSTIRDADEIVVLEHGKTVQRGVHEALIRQDGAYARLLASEEYETEKKSRVESILESL